MTYNLKREGSNFTGCHYLDGIPVKISEKFRPPRKITLPLSYQQHCPVDLLTDEYDFSLENQVLELAETQRRGREAAKRAKVEQLASSIEEFTRLVYSEQKSNAEETWNSTEEHDHPNSQHSANADNRNLHESQPEAKDNEEKTLNGSKPTLGIASSLLNSLEPNSMLKPVPSSNEPNITMGKPDVTLAALNLEDFEAESSPFDSVALKTLDDIEELKSVLQNADLSRSVANTRVQQVYSLPLPNGDVSTGQHVVNPSNPCVTYTGSEEVRERTNESNKTKFALPVLQLTSSSSGAPIPAEYPSLPASPVDHSPHNNTSLSERDSQVNIHKSASEPRQELEGDLQALVRRISDMGFPKARVTRIIDAVGQDDKKVVELLCMIQSFTERGYSTEDVEAAVLQYGHNKTQIKKYLELTLQFRDLGFEDEAIRKALAECDNDGDKALDRLVS